jgi:hypothetical protein
VHCVRELVPTGLMEKSALVSRAHLKGPEWAPLGGVGGCKPNNKAVPEGILPLVRTAFAGGSPDWTRTSDGTKLPRLGNPC